MAQRSLQRLNVIQNHVFDKNTTDVKNETTTTYPVMGRSVVTEFPLSLTFDDVLLVPKRSGVRSRRDVNVKTRLSKSINLNNPVVSSNMDTVTEYRMAVEMARNGGIGIIHRYLSIDEQSQMITRVKRAESFMIPNPYTCPPTTTIRAIRQLMSDKGVNSILVTVSPTSPTLLGIVTSRDIRFISEDDSSNSLTVESVMTPRSALIVSRPNVSLVEAKHIISANKVKKLPLVDSDNQLKGLITSKDIENHLKRPFASLDKQGRLMVGAAVGVKAPEYIKRAEALVNAGVDVLVVDIAHGHSDLAIEAVKELKHKFPNGPDVIAGNVATAEGTRDLILAGADGIKVGVGPGSICITRIVTGCGVPQLSAILECANEAKKHNIPLMADGGIRNSGDIVKALAAGASTVMLGSVLAGTDESPGDNIIKGGKKVKVIRGMAGYGANMSNRERQMMKMEDVFEVAAEGVEGMVPYRGAVAGIVKQLVGGICSGVSYCGAESIEGMQKNAEFVRITGAGKIESGSHDVTLI